MIRTLGTAVALSLVVAPTPIMSEIWLGLMSNQGCGSENSVIDDIFAREKGDSIVVAGERTRGSRCQPDDVAAREYQYLEWRENDCDAVALSHVSIASWCASRESWATSGNAPAYVCQDGSAPRPPDKVRSRPTDPPGQPWGTWRLRTIPCPGDGTDPAEDDLVSAVEREMARLKVKAAPALIAPVTEWFPVQMPMTVYTDAAAQVFEVTLVGTAVEIEVRPDSFSWDFGDGTTPVVTAEQGGPYPDETVTHKFTRKGAHAVTLTTTWSGRFRVNGQDTWRAVAGRATTTHTTPVELREIRSVLS